MKKIRLYLGALSFQSLWAGSQAYPSRFLRRLQENYSIRLSYDTDRATSVALDKATLQDLVYIFVSPTADINRVTFSLDGAIHRIENKPSFDFAGTARNDIPKPFQANSLSAGLHTITAQVDHVGGSTSLSASLRVGSSPSQPDPDIQILSSTSPYRFPPLSLHGSTISGLAHVYLGGSDTTIQRVDFFLDDTEMVGSPSQVERKYPYDFSGTNRDKSSKSWDTNTVLDGSHYINAVILFNNGSTEIARASFLVRNVEKPRIDQVPTPNPIGAATSSPTTTPTPPSLAGGCKEISSLDCGDVLRLGNFVLNFDGRDGGLPDRNGLGTGFTMADPPSYPENPKRNLHIPGLWPERLQLDLVDNVLVFDPTAGIQFGKNNALSNALGVGLDLPSRQVTIRTTLTELPPPPGGWAQAGLWFGSTSDFGRGTSEDNHVKAIVGSPSPGKYVVQASLELDGVQKQQSTQTLSPGISSVSLVLVANPNAQSVEAIFNMGAGDTVLFVFSDLPSEWFSFDQAGIDPSLSTRSFGGIFSSSRHADSRMTFRFSMFSVSGETPRDPPADPADDQVDPPGDHIDNSDLNFDRWAIKVKNPTALAWGPDGKLYVAEIFGTIHAYELDLDRQIVLDEKIIKVVNEDGNRLTLGLAVDPRSTPEKVMLFVGHSDGSRSNGKENSGKVSKIEGPNFSIIEDIIVGLPRAIANHALNNIEFGPDGKLYLAMGGNTGAGSANLADTEFGDRPEQPLSAAVLVADVNNANFKGECATKVAEFGIPTSCDVKVYSSGLRNSYDIAWHSNGQLYATDNGLGVKASVPPKASYPCTGLGNTSKEGNPGGQQDLLLRLQEGKYYGHPNPYRNECIFKDGSFQGVNPMPNYDPPLYDLGKHLSANGILEYRADSFFSKLMGELLIVNFSKGDNMSRTRLSSDGTRVIRHTNLVSGFKDPLPIEQEPSGRIFVGEFKSDQVTVLDPRPLTPEPLGSWSPRKPAPDSLLDAGSTSMQGKLYMIGGKTKAGQHVATMSIYDPVSDSWSSGTPLPGEAVENPAVTAHEGKLYLFGGSTRPFSGALARAFVYDPEIETWSELPTMPTARGGATVQVLNGKLYVVGGMDGAGVSLQVVEVYDPVLRLWKSSTPMTTRRDNPGSAVLGNKLFIFGGRSRSANGTGPTLSAVEVFDLTTKTWSAAAPMPTARRTMVVGQISGRAQVIGGENPLTDVNEEYDPKADVWRELTAIGLGRHGAAGGMIRGKVYVAGGAIKDGKITDQVEAFEY